MQLLKHTHEVQDEEDLMSTACKKQWDKQLEPKKPAYGDGESTD